MIANWWFDLYTHMVWNQNDCANLLELFYIATGYGYSFVCFILAIQCYNS